MQVFATAVHSPVEIIAAHLIIATKISWVIIIASLLIVLAVVLFKAQDVVFRLCAACPNKNFCKLKVKLCPECRGDGGRGRGCGCRTNNKKKKEKRNNKTYHLSHDGGGAGAAEAEAGGKEESQEEEDRDETVVSMHFGVSLTHKQARRLQTAN